MRWPVLVSLGLAASLAIAAVAGFFLQGCDDTEVRYSRLPLRFYSIEFADSLPAGAIDTLEVGALVGYDDCELENGGIERRGDSLFVVGNALCRVYGNPVPSPSSPLIATPPVRDNPRWLRFPVPALGPGSYTVVAGELRDTLIVAGSAGLGTRRRLAAFGTLAAPTANCPDPPASFSQSTPWRRYEVRGTPMPVDAERVELHAIRTGAAICDTAGVSGALRVRSRVPWLGWLAKPLGSFR